MDSLVSTLNSKRRCCMNPGSNHAAVVFNHHCPFQCDDVWRKPL